ncbi:MAG TPA: hypothetical protein VFQ84_02335 [Arenimonas sp.]|uniref:COG4315 family predicted lipoprotein n=1 Tax=Arenimonas sp. TaxID=1872635 RepID=UPI002D80100F|nr:hypothetical protein [Arenimonas sp.]HEU0152164.1 hypothetical protein [Arenimonas sp.]
MTRFLASVLVTLFLACLALVASAAPPAKPRPPSPLEVALASPVPVWQRAGILVEQGGRALYTYTPDLPGQSNCDAKCEALWPPHYAEPGAEPHGPFTLARSSDGRPMWAWQGRPLYRWISDRRRGAAGGDGVAGVWFLVRVPADLSADVTRYFPMPTPRPGDAITPPSTAELSRNR